MSVGINIDAVVVGVEGMADIEVILDVVMVFFGNGFIFCNPLAVYQRFFLPSQQELVLFVFRCVVAVDFSFGQILGKKEIKDKSQNRNDPQKQ